MANMMTFSRGDLLPYSWKSLESLVTNSVPTLPEGMLKMFLFHFIILS